MKKANVFALTIPVIFAAVCFIGCAGGEPEPLPGARASAQRAAVSADSSDAVALLKTVYENYASMESFQAEGTSSESAEGGPIPALASFSSTTTFSIALQRNPHAYGIHWVCQIKDTRTPGTLWNSGEGLHLKSALFTLDLESPSTNEEKQEEESAFRYGTTMSDVPALIPSLFYPNTHPGLAAPPSSAEFNGKETIDGVTCRIVVVQSVPGIVQKFWIDDRLLIQRKHDEYNVDAKSPAEFDRIFPPHLKIDEALVPDPAMRLLVEGMKKRVEESRRGSARTRGSVGDVPLSLHKTSIQTYTQIKVNQPIDPADFAPKSQ